MEFFLLSLDGLCNLVLLALSAVLIARAHDNHIRLWWGITVGLMGLALLYGSVVWIHSYMFSNAYTDSAYGLLRLPPMLRWFSVAVAISLFPIFSLRPTRLTAIRITVFFIPVLVAVLIAICYMLFNGHLTDLHSLTDIVNNIEEQDVAVRLVIFGIALTVVSAYFFTPIFIHLGSVRRKATPFMYVFFAVLQLLLLHYVIYTLIEDPLILYTSGMVNTLPCIVFSIFFLLYENPLSTRLTKSADSEEITNTSTLADNLYGTMREFFEVNTPFVSSDYSLKSIANDLKTSESLVKAAIKSGGFSGFREYMGYLRVQRFKKLAVEQSQKSVKTLMNECGFSSRSTFYRTFAEYEGITPSEYIARRGVK